MTDVIELIDVLCESLCVINNLATEEGELYSRVKDIVEIFRNEYAYFKVITVLKSKMLFYFSNDYGGAVDAFSISFSHDSLSKLRDISTQDIFNLVIQDDYIEVGGKQGKWELTVGRQDNSRRFHVCFDKEETILLRTALFDALDTP